MQPNLELKKKLIKITDNIYEIPKEGNMRVPGRIFANEEMLKTIDETSLNQVRNVATLPGIQKYAIACPDAHMGYGFSIGGVAAFDAENGIISPGGIGFDINCGVRLLATPLKREEVEKGLQPFSALKDNLVGGYKSMTEPEVTPEAEPQEGLQPDPYMID